MVDNSSGIKQITVNYNPKNSKVIVVEVLKYERINRGKS